MKPKACNRCGATYTLETFRALPFVGVNLYPEHRDRLEQRNCPCGSTLAIWTDLLHQPIDSPDMDAEAEARPPGTPPDQEPPTEASASSSPRVVVLARTRIHGEATEAVHPRLLEPA